MLLLSVNNVSRGYDATPLFEEVSFELHAGDRVGLVGPNGAGKTTLLKVIAGHEYSDTGDVKLHAGARLGELQQLAEFAPGRTVIEEARSAFDELLAVQREFEAVAERLSVATDEQEHRSLAARFDRLNELLRTQDAYTLDHKIEAVLSGLGFRERDLNREIVSFSGGQQRRLLLAKLLLSAPDVMLLDEPSNHLDIDTTRWLEEYLARQPQGMIIVSHDRYFLDKVSTRTFELHEKRISTFPGNFTQYVRLRDEKFERQMKEWESQTEFVEKQEEYVRRAHYGQLAKQAQSRLKVLDKIERIAKPTKVGGPNIRFSDVTRSGDYVFQVEDLAKSYGENHLFSELSFDVKRGQRLGIMGANGSGKTTLLRILLDDEVPSAGKVTRGHLVQVGYLDQHLKQLDEEKTVIRAVWPEPDESLTEQKMRDLLGAFGLQGKIVEQQVKSLSGGERSRAALARLTVEGANVLVLDEPTNHLDLWACESLEQAIKAFDGTVIVVSHDRYFLNKVADLTIVFHGRRPEVVYGNYDTYELMRANRGENAFAGWKNEDRDAPAAKPAEKKPAPAAPAAVKPKRKWKYPYRKQVEIEAEIATVETQIGVLESAMQDVELYKDADRFRQTMATLESTKQKLAQLYEHWEEAAERSM
ncbi:MAG: ABC-F family ATP-binding cassette domain-containing protein [Gemmataceae bacterium]